MLSLNAELQKSHLTTYKIFDLHYSTRSPRPCPKAICAAKIGKTLGISKAVHKIPSLVIKKLEVMYMQGRVSKDITFHGDWTLEFAKDRSSRVLR